MAKKDLINEAVGYLRAGAEAAKKYYQGSAVPKHEASVLNRLSPSDRKKELAKQILHRKAIDKGRRDFDAKDRLTVMDAGIDSGGLGGAGISARPGISERMIDNTYELKKGVSDILWGGSGVNSLDYKKHKAKQLAQKLLSTEGKHVRAIRLQDKAAGTKKEGISRRSAVDPAEAVMEGKPDTREGATKPSTKPKKG